VEQKQRNKEKHKIKPTVECDDRQHAEGHAEGIRRRGMEVGWDVGKR
jgi:hypothetical protein